MQRNSVKLTALSIVVLMPGLLVAVHARETVGHFVHGFTLGYTQEPTKPAAVLSDTIAIYNFSSAITQVAGLYCLAKLGVYGAQAAYAKAQPYFPAWMAWAKQDLTQAKDAVVAYLEVVDSPDAGTSTDANASADASKKRARIVLSRGASDTVNRLQTAPKAAPAPTPAAAR